MEIHDARKKQNELFLVFVFILVGCTVLGVGIGMLLSEIWACTIIGAGTGFLVNAILFLRNFLLRS
jgi:hypothetical protein